MRNVVMAAMLVAAGVSSSYVTRTGGSESPAEAVEKGTKILAAEPPLPQPIDDPSMLISDFLDLKSTPQNKKTLSCKASSGSKRAPSTVTFLIATVPDPERTHLSLYFDRFLEAIIVAAEAEGFSYDRYWLPWHVSHEAPDPHRLADRDTLDGRGEQRHRKPGVIIFQKRFTPGQEGAHQTTGNFLDLLVVFLVGETPTAGVNRHQFQAAVHYIHSAKGCDPRLRVLGPTFSGSATSLHDALHGFLYEAISGAASSRIGLAGFASTTIHSYDFIGQALAKFLGDQFRTTGAATLLAEAGTDFGLGISVLTNVGKGIYYPRELSRLRNVYPEQANSAAAQVANLQQQLSLRLRDSRAGEDTVPQFSDQTPLTQESVLLQISETLRRDHIGLAIITGTDVLDVLFLSRHLRELSPDVRLVIWDADLLFVHGTDTLDFSGMLALSTYPLVPADHSWTTDQRGTAKPPAYYDFPSDMTQGVYNACRLLLNPGAEGLREYSAPGSPCSARPPVWLSVIGHDAYWPLSFYEDPGIASRGQDPLVKDGEFNGPTFLDPGWPTRAWSFIFYSTSLLASLYAVIYCYLLLCGDLPRWCSLLHPQPYVTPPSWRADYSFLLSSCLLLAYTSCFVFVMRLAYGNQTRAWQVMLGVGIAVETLLLLVAALGLRRIPSLILAGAGGAVCLAMTYLVRPFTNETFFRALRSLQLGSGVGPNLPLFFMFLAFAWWASIEMQRARLVAEHRPDMRNIAGNQAAFNIASMDLWFGQSLLQVDATGWIVAAVACAVTAFAAAPHIRSLEGLLFDWMVCGMVVALGTLLFLRTYSFLRIWRALHRLLEALELQPIRFAFSNLPNDVSWSPLWQYGARRKSYTLHIRSLGSLRTLKECAPDYYAGLNADIETLQGHTNEILSQVNRGVEEDIFLTRATQQHLAAIAVKLSIVLEASKWKESSSETIAKLEKACDADKVRKGFANWFGWGADFEVRTAPSDLAPEEKPGTLAAEIVALRYLSYFRYVMRHLRNILSFITTGFILMTLALNCYPFQTLNLIRWSITIVFVLIAVALLYAFQEMSRNEILSRITDTKAGSLDGGFYTRVVSVGALPVLAVVASHFPSVGRFLFSWVQPAISALH